MSAATKTLLTFSRVEAAGGLGRAFAMSRAELVEAVKDSGLKGRGGAGFPTGLKWQLAAERDSAQKYVVCNADEGEPGTFKDRVILTDHADLVFAGMAAAGYAIGATRGIVYLRGEYTYLRPQLEALLAELRDANQLGSSLLGHEGVDFDIEVRMGAGSYVCGEETALIESLEGFRGEPRNRPPFPVNTGYLDQATIVNNVETLAWVPCILSLGVDWWKGLGTARSTGPKLFSISGDCETPGVFEFPFGVCVHDLLEACGAEGAKAVQVGGASGNCVPAGDFDRPVCYEDLSTGGSMIVFGPDRDMLSVARNFLEFFVHESCGQCTPCREGNEVLLEGVRMLEEGLCSSSYLNELVSLGETMRLASKCGLGQSSPNAFISIVRGFREEILGRVTASA
jgi:[NiFe] hydrogenase diaphorase moiety large subunit